MCRRIASFVVVAAMIIALSPGRGAAQYPFGKNKVVYTNQKWKVLKTANVEVYYYPGEEALVTYAAMIVEDTFQEYSDYFDIKFDRPLPLVFYSSHYDFQQTNIIPSLISDYTAGFTDLAKGRIAIPFSGSIGEFRHVIRHEMVHAFMLEKLSRVLSDRGKFASSYPPLWFTEGLAEYVANREGDTQGRMFIRDALINESLPDLENIWRIEGSFLMYKEGEAVMRYIATNFGDRALVRILENWWIADNLSIVLKATIDMDLRELNDAFFRAMKRRYYPAVLYGAFTQDVGDQITAPHTFHNRPVAARTPSGDVAIYALGAEDGVIGIIGFEPDREGRIRRRVLIGGSLSTDFESIPAFRSKIEARGDTLMFVSKRQERDAVYLWSIGKKEPLASFSFPDLSVVSSPTLSPDGTRVVFSAIDRTGKPDLFLYDIGSGRLERITDDVFAEQDPDFHPRENKILFSSDRCGSSLGENFGIYELDLDTREIETLTCGSGQDAHPDWSPDGASFLFSSDRGGTYDIYRFETATRTVTRQTQVIGGVTMPAYLPDGNGFVASGYTDGEYHLYRFPLKHEAGAPANVVAASDTSEAAKWGKRSAADLGYTTQNYRQKLGIDFAGVGIAIDPNFGSVGNGGQIVLTDILGNHQYYMFVANSSEGVDDFLKGLNFGFEYVNLTRRLHYSLGFFRLNSYTRDPILGYRSEKRAGVSTGLSYPFSRFSRVDASVVGRYIERDTGYEGIGLARSFVGTVFLSHVVDKSLWTIGGPLKGWRYYITTGLTADFQNRGFENTTLLFDVRKYVKITERIVFAERFITRNSWGSDFELFYLGGPWDLRGYDYREFVGRSTYLFNSEVRFPLIDHFALSFPFGTLETPRMRGALFFDMGRTDRWLMNTDWLGSLGVGVELNLGYAPVLRVNFTRATDFSTISPKTEFEFFIGYNY
jgi:WD40 repeat protein